MLSVQEMKGRRNEWLQEHSSWALLDANDCMHRVSLIYSEDGSSAARRWALAWTFLDSPYGVPQIASSTWVSADAAKAWIEESFAEHFEWFDPPSDAQSRPSSAVQTADAEPGMPT